MYRFGIIGTGRIGAMHAEVVSSRKDATVSWCCDVSPNLARAIADRVGAKVSTDFEEVIGDAAVDAVIVASPTNTHIDIILSAAQAGKAVFCEKPIDLDIRKVDKCRRQMELYSVPVQIGFHRRFDPSHRAVRDSVSSGEIGALELLQITSRSPGPIPPRAYLESCGGHFRDSTIHDLDMARFVMNEEPVEVFAMAANRVDPLFKELGDVDTAMVVMQTGKGTLCHINNSRRAIYGHDQRVEAFGSKGMVRSNNAGPNEVVRYTGDGSRRHAAIHHSFIERYRVAYENEIGAFIKVLESGDLPMVSFEDGRRALILANAARASFEQNRPIRVNYE